MDVRTCITCKWASPHVTRALHPAFRDTTRWDMAVCEHPIAPRDPVVGDPPLCFAARMASIGFCGPDGRFHERRRPDPPPQPTPQPLAPPTRKPLWLRIITTLFR